MVVNRLPNAESSAHQINAKSRASASDETTLATMLVQEAPPPQDDVLASVPIYGRAVRLALIFGGAGALWFIMWLLVRAFG